MPAFSIHSSHTLALDPDWRTQLIALLGSKPRRLSRWCELGLFGALACVRKAAGKELPGDLAIRIYSQYGTLDAVQHALSQAQDFLPMPFAFMQTQPGQLLNALGSALAWHGDGYNITYRDRQAGEATLLHSVRHSALLAWVDEQPELISRWLWLEKASAPEALQWQPAASIFQIPAPARWLKIDSAQVIFYAE